ncbi:hypothetical protein HHI36_004935 [Cryptolaemus montrouzieri]|uniref:Uncharacterized protein n=1 Tax=Cryptolaemus montrouzieri TaxID=559131 RepID=A0ABD2NSP7_9CUCU
METFKCHNKTELTCYVCIRCFSVLHKSYADRDWKSKFRRIGGHKIICYNDENGEMMIETVMRENADLRKLMEDEGEDYYEKLITKNQRLTESVVELTGHMELSLRQL